MPVSGVLAWGGVVAEGRGVVGLFRRKDGGSQRVILSGFADAAEYEARAPSWESSELDDVDGAVLAAQAWQASTGPDSVVEVIVEDGSVWRVVRIVDANGVERT